MLSTVMGKVCCCIVLILCSLSSVFLAKLESSTVNYVATATLPDGEKEVRMRFKNVVVRETSTTHQNTQSGVRRGLLLRQVASGPHFLQLIYKLNNVNDKEQEHRKLAECEIINDWNVANEFRNQFKRELWRAGVELHVPENKSPVVEKEEEGVNGIDVDQHEILMEQEMEKELEDGGYEKPVIDLDQGMEEYKNVTVRIFNDNELTPEMSKAFNVHAHQRRCRRLHKKLKQIVAAKKNHSETINSTTTTGNRRVRREAFRVGIMPGTLWCGDGSLAEKYESMGAHVGADRCCREHDGCPFIIDAMSSKYELFNYRMHTVSHCACDERRRKRDLGNAMRLPGTEWCGRGYSAKELNHLGGFTGADNCCRYHDIQCPFYIEAFEEKYGMFNWRMYTINHCTCDERFRSCLKQTNTGAANFVGKIFFNVVQTKCFLLKPEKSCAKLSWWGKCLKYEYIKQAHLREPIPY